MVIEIRELGPQDHAQVLNLWPNGPSNDKSIPERLLRQRSRLSVVAHQEGSVVGAVLCGRIDDQFQHWIVVAESHRATPIAKQLIDKALLKLLAIGLTKCHICLADKTGPSSFWGSVTWRTDATGLPQPRRPVEPVAQA